MEKKPPHSFNNDFRRNSRPGNDMKRSLQMRKCLHVHKEFKEVHTYAHLRIDLCIAGPMHFCYRASPIAIVVKGSHTGQRVSGIQSSVSDSCLNRILFARLWLCLLQLSRKFYNFRSNRFQIRAVAVWPTVPRQLVELIQISERILRHSLDIRSSGAHCITLHFITAKREAPWVKLESNLLQ